MAPCKIAQSADQDKQEGIGEPDLNGCDWSKLESLASLDVSHNQLETLPDDLAKMTALETVDCRSNLLTELPQTLDLVNCTSFLLDDNKLEALSDGFAVGLAKKLESISVRNNAISTTSMRIGDMRQVKSVYLENNALETLDKGITQCRLLELLSLKHNKLHYTPKGFATMFRLKTLDLSYNLFETIDEKAIESLVSLTSLDLSHNKLVNFPQRLGRLNKLQSLNYSHNQLTLLPQNCFKGCGELFTVRIDHNLLTTKGVEAGRLDSVQSLEVLHLDFNEMDQLPEELADLPQLRSLTFSHNPCCSRPEDALEPFWGLRDRSQSIHVGAAEFDEPVELDEEDNTRDARKARRLMVLQVSSRGTERLERGEPLDAVEPLSRAAEKHARLLVDEPDTANFSHHFHLGAAYVARARARKLVADAERKRRQDEEDKIEAARKLAERKAMQMGIFPEDSVDATLAQSSLQDPSLMDSTVASDATGLRLSRRALNSRSPGRLAPSLGSNLSHKSPGKLDAAIDADLIKAQLALDEAVKIDVELRREDGDIEGEDNMAFQEPRNCAVEILHARGSASLRRGDARKAVEDLNQALLARKDHAPSLTLRARARLELGQFPQASRDCQKAWRIELKRAGLWPLREFDLDNLHRDVNKALQPLDLVELRRECDRGVQSIRLMKCDLPENDRCYLQTAEGLCYRRRHEIKALDVEGRSKRRRWLARRKAEHDAIEKAEIDRRNDEDAVVAYNKALIDRSTAELAWRKARYDLEIIEERRKREEEAAAKKAEEERQEKEGAAAREAFETCMMMENELRAVWIAIDRAAREAEEERSRAIKKAAMEKKKNMGKRKPAARRRPGRR